MPQSYVLGILVDYLIPKLYLTEILVLGILLLTPWQKPKNWLFPTALGIFLLTLLPSVWGASLLVVAISRFAQLTLWLAFAFWVSQNTALFKKELLTLLSLSVGGVVILALAQLHFQHSIFGYWALGEPVLSPSLGGVAKGSFLGVSFLRPYGTFPHPNVLGGVLSVLALWFWVKKKLWGFGFSVVGTLISFSQVTWASLGLGFLATLMVPKSFPLLVFDFNSLLQNPSIQRRWDLLVAGWEMFKEAPFLGVGLGHFTKALPSFGLPKGILLFIQPVHNIFALVAAESGIIAFLSLLALWGTAFWESLSRKRWALAVSLGQLTLLGSFDHYLYTLPQGLFLLALTLGLVFAPEDLLDS